MSDHRDYNERNRDDRPSEERAAAERRAADEWDAAWEESERRAAEKRAAERQNVQRRPAERRVSERRTAQQRDASRRSTDRRGTDRSGTDRRRADADSRAERYERMSVDARRRQQVRQQQEAQREYESYDYDHREYDDYDYDEPRQKGGAGRILKKIVTVLVVLILIPVIFFLGAFLAKTILTGDAGLRDLPFGIGATPVPEIFEEPEMLPTPTPAPTPTPVPTPTPAPTPPPIYDDGTDGYLSSGIYIWNDHAYELFYGGESSARDYAAAISSYKGYLGDDINVYNMVVPNHSEFGLPKRIRDDMGCTSQRDNLSAVYDNYTADVKAVDIYDNLNLHNDEYIYFNTDTHWAMLGAYYAAEVFCEVAEVEAPSLDKMNKTTPDDNFTGYLAYVTGESCLYENPDHIDLYEPKCSYTASVSYDGWYFSDLDCINSSDTGLGYSMVLYGDNPLFRVINHDGHTGRKVVVVKDSYGNALAPFLVNSFDEVHVIDFRHFPQNLVGYCQENGITDVLFFNNVMSANTWSQIETMNSLFW